MYGSRQMFFRVPKSYHTTQPAGITMYIHQSAKHSQLHSRAGRWLRELRERRGLSQRELAKLVGVEVYTFIAQMEHGRGRIPPDRYLVWANALQVEPREFARTLMAYYDPVTYGIIFGETPAANVVQPNAVQSPTVIQMRKAP